MKNRARDCLLIIAVCAAIPLAPGVAQTQPPAAATATAPASALLKTEELDQLMAPIALYPDTLLASVLMAATYPLEVVEATRWVKDNKALKGDALKAAADKKGWDESVKQLTATPSVLEMMNGKLDWTQKLGNAVLAQQTDVMDAVQRLRARAESQNKLQTTKQQKVSTQTQNNKKVIVIEPAEPNTIYVPYYNPAVVYGAWPYPEYPPYYYPPYAGYYAGAAIATGIAFGAGIAVGAWATRDRYWGGGVRWGDNNININRQTNINNINANNNWRHNPAHRQGVRYNNADVANRFGKGNDIRNGAQNRMDFRGKDGRQVINPDRNAEIAPRSVTPLRTGANAETPDGLTPGNGATPVSTAPETTHSRTIRHARPARKAIAVTPALRAGAAAIRNFMPAISTAAALTLIAVARACIVAAACAVAVGGANTGEDHAETFVPGSHHPALGFPDRRRASATAIFIGR